MAQQINLCSPVLKKQHSYFVAQTMAQALAVFFVLGGALCAYAVWSLNGASLGLEQVATSQAKEIESLQAAIAASRVSAAPPDVSLVAQAQAQRDLIAQKERTLQALTDGAFLPGQAHSDRLALVARSIPQPVWVNKLQADATRMELSGYTLEPAALNDWVARLALNPLMRGLRLDTVRVENTALAAVKVPATGTATAPAAGGRPTWTFNLVSAQPEPVQPAGGAAKPGGAP